MRRAWAWGAACAVCGGCGGPAQVTAPVAPLVAPRPVAARAVAEPVDDACVRWTKTDDHGTWYLQARRLDDAGHLVDVREAIGRSGEGREETRVQLVWGDDGRLRRRTIDRGTTSPTTQTDTFEYGPHGELVAIDAARSNGGKSRTTLRWEGSFERPANLAPMRLLDDAWTSAGQDVFLPQLMGAASSPMGPAVFFHGTVRWVHADADEGDIAGSDEYDASGRRVRHAYATAWYTYRYDDAGQVVETRDDQGLVTTYVWEAGHVTASTIAFQGRTVRMTIAYDARGRPTREETIGPTERAVATATYGCDVGTSDPFDPPAPPDGGR